MSELPVEIPTVTSEGNTLNLNIPVTSATSTVTETETRSPRTFLPNGSPLDLLQQPPVDHRCGYNVFWRDR